MDKCDDICKLVSIYTNCESGLTTTDGGYFALKCKMTEFQTCNSN